MQINRFDGGINTKLAPHLLKSSEAVASVNIDPTSGVLKPFNQSKPKNAQLGKSFIWFNDLWVSRDTRTSFAQYNKVLFSGDGVTAPEYTIDGVNWNSLHIPAPDKPLKVQAVSLNTLTEMEQVTTPFELTDGTTPLKDNQVAFRQEVSWAVYDEDTHYYNVDGVVAYILQLRHPNIPIYATLKGEKQHTFIFYKDPNSEILYKYAVSCIDFSPQYPESRVKLFVANPNTQPLKYEKVEYSTWLAGIPRKGLICVQIDPRNYELFNVQKDFKDFKSGMVLDYVLRWKPTGSGVLTTEQKSITLEYQNAVCYGTRIKKIDGYTLEAFRNGKKCVLTEHEGWYYDNAVTSESLVIAEVTFLHTYYISHLGVETPPSPTTSISAVANGQEWLISWEEPKDPQIDQVRIYRFGGGVSVPSLVGSYPVALKQIQTSLAADIDGRILTTSRNIPAPKKLTGLSVIYAMLWGFQGRTLYYSHIGNPFAWSEYNTITMEDEITGFGGVPNGILIFSKTQTYLLTGQTPQNFTKFLLSNTIGCVSSVSVQRFANGLIWLGENGIYMSNGGNISDITQTKFNNFSLSRPFASIVWNHFYILALADYALIIDLRNLRFFYLAEKVFYLANKGVSLYHIDSSGELFETFGGDAPRELQFSSATYAEGSLTNRKNYSTIYFHSTGDLKVKVFLDDVIAGETPLTRGVTELKLSAQNSRGYGIRFEVSGTGTLNEIEYKAEGRQNGR